MFTQLWSSVAGEGESAKDRRKALLEDDDETEWSTENEDEIAERMLTQFPVYGSAHIEFAGDDGDWLEDELLDEPLDDQQNVATFLQTGSKTSMTIPGTAHPGGASSNKQEKGQSNTVLSLDWDLQEQELWKPKQPTTLSVPAKSQDRNAPSFYWNDAPRQKWVNAANAEDAQHTNANNAAATAPMASTSRTSGSTFLSRRYYGLASSKSEPELARFRLVRMSSSSTDKQSPQPSRQDDDDDRQHWMPDQLCKECYNCEQPFTVFRRRHHCRLCGQVFCSACSAFFVEWDEQRTLRACQLCFDQVNRGALVLPSAATASASGGGGGGPSSASHHAPASDTVLPQHKDQPLLEPMDEYMDSSTSNVSIDKRSARDVVVAEATAVAAASKPKTRPEVAANRHLGLTAATHLEQLGYALVRSDAPLLLAEIQNDEHELEQWMNTLMTLATKCLTVQPDVKYKGDLLDIRPHCKLKVISGGSHHDCAYLSGVLFRKNVTHKSMAKEITDPRIMLLSGGIEFTRTENRIASLDTLLEQEDKYMEILIGKILKLKPDILMVGRSVSRKAQELLLRAQVVLVQHVKSTLMNRISRQTGATIISSTDHVMNQFPADVLGKCRRFRLVTFRDNEVWTDDESAEASVSMVALSEGSSASDASPDWNGGGPRRCIPLMLQDRQLKNHERQAVLAANMLGETVIDGTEAVKQGLAKRGVAQTYIMLEGCPKQLGCTVVLRGASRAALKQVKRVLRFLINVAYNLKLETSYLQDRSARLPPDFVVKPEHLFSSSLCVDYGSPPSGRKVRPWNGGANDMGQRSISGNITALDHQSILITSVWMTDKTQCCPAEVKGICYYSQQDVSLGQFLRDSCFNLSLKCQNPSCKKSVLDHSLSFIHSDGLIKISVEQMDDPLPPSPLENSGSTTSDNSDDSDLEDSPIATWTFCVTCSKVVTPLVYISEDTWKFSFGKFLEVFFYNRDAVMNSPEHGCSCQLQNSATLYFGCGRLAARFTYEQVKPFGVFVRRCLPIDEKFHRSEAIRQMDVISVASSQLFVKFDKHIEKVSREARSLFGSAANRPEHLQTVLSELNMIGSEVDHAAKTLQEKIASVSDKCRRSPNADRDIVNEALFRFPWYSRRYLFMLTSAWNERLSAAGQAISAMKKLAGSTTPSSSQRGDIPIVGDGSTEDLLEGMRRLRKLNEVYSRFNVTDVNTVLPTFPAGETQTVELVEYDDDMDDDPFSADGVDADVLASRRRLYNSKPVDSLPTRDPATTAPSNLMPRKSLGTQRSLDLAVPPPVNTTSSSRIPRTRSEPLSPHSTASSASSQSLNKVTPGGAVKSAITRFFNRGAKELDPYTVDLGTFKEGRPRLEPGVGGLVVPVMDDQPSTIIAYSLSSAEYGKQFKKFSRMDPSSPTEEKPPPGPGGQSRSGEGPTLATPSDTADLPRRNDLTKTSQTPASQQASAAVLDEKQDIERRMLTRNKSHIKHTFRDFDEKMQQTCKFVCTTYWATQFHAVRQAFLAQSSKDQTPLPDSVSTMDIEKGYVQSLSTAFSWEASGGKSGASFARTLDERFVIKCISRTELQMFLDCAPAYFEYLNKAFFHGLPTVLCKIVGVYQIGYHNRVTGKRMMEQVAVMQNIFYGRKIARTFDLKGSLRGRFARHLQGAKDATESTTRSRAEDGSDSDSYEDETAAPPSSAMVEVDDGGEEDRERRSSGTLLDGDFLEFTNGRPLPLSDRAKAVFHMSVLNDTLFLSIINVLDYSILVGIDEENMELVVGIIDFMRQYDILKQMERVGKSLPMVVGSEAPTIIQPPLYKARFTNAMERYFSVTPNKWTTI